MTQAYNLSQLANNLNTNGQLDATDGLVNAVPIANGGTGATSADGARANLDVAQSQYSMPTGGIILWSGASAAIPTGWLLCDGASGTPDLRNRFVIGAGGSYAVGATAGSKDAVVVSHTHTGTTAQSGPHTHIINEGSLTQSAGGTLTSGDDYTNIVAYTQTTSSGGDHVHTITTNSTGVSGIDANLPPYYALCYIMKS